MIKKSWVTGACAMHRRVRGTGQALALWGAVVCAGLVALQPAHAARDEPTNKLVPVDLQAIASSKDVIVAVGVAGTVLKSVDQGETWLRAGIDPRASLIGLTVCPDGEFLALDFYSRIWFSDAEVTEWTPLDLPNGGMTPLAMTCAPDGSFWVVGTESTVIRTRDHGETWTKHSFGEDKNLTVIQFLDRDNAILAGEFGFVAESNDSGRTWTAWPQVDETFYPYDAWFENLQNGWLVGRAGQLLHTADGGQTWDHEVNPLGGVPMYGLIHVPEAGRLFAVGEVGLVIERIASGWRVVGDQVPGGYLRDAVLVKDSKTLIAVGGSGAVTPLSIPAGEGSLGNAVGQSGKALTVNRSMQVEGEIGG